MPSKLIQSLSVVVLVPRMVATDRLYTGCLMPMQAILVGVAYCEVFSIKTYVFSSYVIVYLLSYIYSHRKVHNFFSKIAYFL